MMGKDEVIKSIKLGTMTPEEGVREFEKQQQQVITTVRKYVPPTMDDLKGRYATNQELVERAMRSKIPFIDPALVGEFKLTQGLILIGGVSGRGKSTTNANILAGFVKSQPNGKAMVITNEESTGEVYDRVACVLLEYNFREYRNREMPRRKIEDVQNCAKDLMGQILVEDGSGVYDMTCTDDLKAALAYVAEADVQLASIDYFQTANWSRSKPDLAPVQVSKDLGFWMKDYGRKVPKPVIMYVQLKESSEESEFKERVENDRTIFNHCFMAVEVVPDFETRISKFHFVKDRFGDSQGKTLEMRYEGGRFVLNEGAI